jgi:hypothetical protein
MVYLLLSSVPELILYLITFFKIFHHNKYMARSGILKPDVLQNRKQKNTLNIKMTCCLWLVQFSANILTFTLVKLFYGKNKFFHHLFAILTSSVNFNLFPFLYVIMTDEPVKTALAGKQYLELFQLLFFH